MRMVWVLAVLGLSLFAGAGPAAAGNDCRQYKPTVSIVVGPGTIPPSKRQAEIHYFFRGAPACWDAVHLRFGIAGREPYIIQEIKSGRNCGIYKDGRSLPACAHKVGTVEFGTTYVVGLQECDKHALSSDECSSWASQTVTTPRN